jgi:hypothetical protein
VRQIFSVRFFAAVGGVLALFFLLTAVFATRSAIDDAVGDDTASAVITRRIDLVERVASAAPASVVLDLDGLTARRVVLTIDESRAVTIASGTPGEVHCTQLDRAGRCAVVLDLLGEAVVWFALVPTSGGPTGVPLPAIDTLDEGIATLVNGWQLRYAPVLDRRCGDEAEFSSYRDLRDELGDDFTSVFDITEQRLVAVVCRERVPYAPTTTTLPTSTTGPAATASPTAAASTLPG